MYTVWHPPGSHVHHFLLFTTKGTPEPVREYATNTCTDNEIQTWQPDDNSKCETSERVVVLIGISVFCRVLRQCQIESHLSINPIKQQSSCCSSKWQISHPLVVPKSLLDCKKPLQTIWWKTGHKKAIHCFLLSLFASLVSSVVIHPILV